MATKTFKIGLSATDKQNMAQDIYERLLDLTFAEYDSSETYNTGDFVVYNNVLYQCLQDNVTGTWDSSKWQTATLQDLLDDVEDAVSQVNDKANVDGNYPTMTVGLADNLTPYGDDSGAEQSNPFISNGTGTNNNTEIVTVGDYGLLRSKNGNTVCVNQLTRNPDFAISTGTTYWSAVSGSRTISNNVCTLTDTSSSTSFLTQDLGQTIPSGHKVLLLTKVVNNSDYTSFSFRLFNGYSNDQGIQLGSFNTPSAYIFTADSDKTRIDIRGNGTHAEGKSISIYYVNVINLTQMFNGNIPQDLLDHPDHFSWYYNGDLSYNTGTLVNANGVKLVSTGRNLFNKDTAELNKYIDHSNGTLASSNNFVATDFIEITPNSQLYLSIIGTSDYSEWGACYDKDKNFISSYDMRVNGITSGQNVVPSNARFIRVSIPKAYYEQATISLYYTPEQGGEGYDQYYPYEAPYEVDTGSEVLRSAGSVYDYKTPDGTINRNVGVQLLSELNFAVTDHIFRCDFSTQMSINSRNGIMVGYRKATGWSDLSDNDKTWLRSSDSNLYIHDNSYDTDTAFENHFTSNDVFYYELATPTTEQGTSFSENLPINDYGMLYWDNTNGVPQGNTIFFPVNYKGFVDDMYSRVDGDSSDYALNSELNAKFEAYLKSLSGYDATATQVLKNVEGTLTWITEE